MRGKLLSRASLMTLAFGADAAAAVAAGAEPPAAAATPAPPAPAPAAQPAADNGGEGGAAAPAAGAEAEAAPEASATAIDPAAAEAGDTVLAADALAVSQEAHARGVREGYAAANTRAQLVFQDEACLKDPATAAFFLFNSDANAQSVIAQVKARPGAAAAAPASRPGAAQPRINLTGGNGASAAAAEGAEDGGDQGMGAKLWDQFAPAAGVNGGPNALTIGGQTYQLTPAVPALPAQ